MTEIVKKIVDLENVISEKILMLSTPLTEINERNIRIMYRLDKLKTVLNEIYRIYCKSEHYDDSKRKELIRALSVLLNEINDEINELNRFIS